MKKLLFGLLFAASFGLTSCGDDDGECKTCTSDDGGISITTEYCQDGDNVTATVAGISVSAPGSLDDAVSAAEADGATCN
ncbi:MAG: hypothetical protein AAGD05_17165 [Bacteroidota bacterium]